MTKAIHEVATSKTITATILSGASTTEEIDLEGHQLAAIQMPSAWTAAGISYLAATESGGTFQAVYNNGIEVTATVAASTCAVAADNALCLAPLRFIKIRSGTAGTPVNQTADRTLTLILKR